MTGVAHFLQGRILRFFLVCLALYAVVAMATDAPVLILFGNGVALSLSAGVSAAYFPVFLIALASPRPGKGDYLGAGIFLSWASWFVAGTMSVMARDMGWPWIYNTDWTTFRLLLTVMAGMLHLWAPNAVEGRVPRARWVTTGIVVALGFFGAFALWSMHFPGGTHPAIELR